MKSYTLRPDTFTLTSLPFNLSGTDEIREKRATAVITLLSLVAYASLYVRWKRRRKEARRGRDGDRDGDRGRGSGSGSGRTETERNERDERNGREK